MRFPPFSIPLISIPPFSIPPFSIPPFSIRRLVCGVTKSEIEAKTNSKRIPPFSIPPISIPPFSIHRLVCGIPNSQIEAKRVSMRLPPISIPRISRIRRLDFSRPGRSRENSRRRLSEGWTLDMQIKQVKTPCSRAGAGVAGRNGLVLSCLRSTAILGQRSTVKFHCDADRTFTPPPVPPSAKFKRRQ